MMRLLLLSCVVAASSCQCGLRSVDVFRFYEVERTIIEECDIQPDGEFCDEPEGFAPPVTEVWGVGAEDGEVRVYIDQEVWIANPLQEGEDASFVTADKLEVASREPGPCVTTTTRAIELLADAEVLTGTIAEKSRVEGPEACGATPTGLRTTARVDGTIVGAP